jgi:2-polyprenyl-6-methoxyphenol hydroxylase-like FAD-dependent oxidoreductase
LTAEQEREAPVLIAGGGLIGLSMAMFLAQHGVRSIAIERLRGGSPLPRAAHFHLRTIELFRAAGIEQAVIAQSAHEFLPEGAIIAMDSLSGRKLADIIPSLNAGVEEVSPCRRLFVSQPGLEPILRRAAREAGATVVEGVEVTGVEQDGDGVTVATNDGAFRGRYLVGADGAHSTVRELLGIPFEGRGVFSNSITIYFTADLWPQLGDKPLSVIYINNPMFGGFFRMNRDCQAGFLVVNTVGDPTTNPDAANAAGDVSEERLVALVRAGAGVPDLPVRIDGVARWRAVSDVARRYRDGRVFLAGDAAHLMPPNGGFGGNTGIHDAYNLAWKLAYVLDGVAGVGLLDSYERERLPVGRFTVEQAYTRYVTRTATYLGATDFEPLVPDFNVELGYVHHSGAVIGDDPDQMHVDPRETGAEPGTRAPHVWLEDAGGARISTLDLFGHAMVLLTTDPAAWQVKGVKVHAVDDRVAAAYALHDGAAVLIRPDGVVAWRGSSEAGTDGLRQALVAVLAH